MAEEIESTTQPVRSGERRGTERRKGDRRREDRRLPVPIWRRPWALVLYGAVGALLLVMVSRSRPDPVPVGGEDEVTMTAPPAIAADTPRQDAPGTLPEDARRREDHERLMAEGDAVKGRLLHVVLYCTSISQVSLRNVDQVESSVAELADGTGRVPAAECKWGPPRNTEPRPDVLLLVPPPLAESFAVQPEVEDGFIRRRRIDTTVEWVGRSDALALRTAVVLRGSPGGP
jgi:hypothetical protein